LYTKTILYRNYRYFITIFNVLLDSGVFPEQWKEAIIVPMHKKGGKNNVNNYRGVTLLSCLSKNFTSVLNNRIVNFRDKNQGISDSQFGFKKGSSAIDAIFA
jgi:hypothetical protein